jgi:hypothetical protein
MSSVRTPTKQKKKAIPPCENVELEFTQRFLLLLTSLYDVPSTEEITRFPPPPPDGSGDLKQSSAKVPPFHSGVWDIRVKKALETRITNDKLTADSLSEQVLQLRDSLAADAPDLNDIFVPRKAERPQIPRYIKNSQEDEEELKQGFKPRGRPQTENLIELAKIFTQRLKRQDALSQQRSHRRFVLARRVEREHKEFVSHLHKSPPPPDALRVYLDQQRASAKGFRQKKTEALEEGQAGLNAWKRRENATPDRVPLLDFSLVQ